MTNNVKELLTWKVLQREEESWQYLTNTTTRPVIMTIMTNDESQLMMKKILAIYSKTPAMPWWNGSSFDVEEGICMTGKPTEWQPVLLLMMYVKKITNREYGMEEEGEYYQYVLKSSNANRKWRKNSEEWRQYGSMEEAEGGHVYVNMQHFFILQYIGVANVIWCLYWANRRMKALLFVF